MEISNLSLEDKKNSTVYLYTGTSCMNTGTNNAKAAICICTNEDENDTIIEMLDNELCTNQKAELHAIYRSLSIVTDETSVLIVSRSEYAVKCVTEWYMKWKKDNWQKVPKKSVENIELIQDIVEFFEELVQKDKDIQICQSTQVPNKYGNKIAQKFARQILL